MKSEYTHTVDVVFCRDCDYYNPDISFCRYWERYMEPNEYCSKFEVQLDIFHDDML